MRQQGQQAPAAKPAVVVTGATGFVGGRIARHLEAAGFKVIAAGRRTNPGFTHYLQWDISQPAPAYDRPVDAVVHAAAKVDDWGRYDDFRAANVAGTANVAARFPDARRFIHISSASVYRHDTNPLTEDSPLASDSKNPYVRSKIAAEAVLTERPGTVILRPHVIYGTGDTTLLPRLLRAHRFRRLWAVGNGRNRLSATHIDNLCGAVGWLLRSNRLTTPPIYNVADSDSYVLDELLRRIMSAHRLSGRPAYLPRPVAMMLAAAAEQPAALLPGWRPPLSRYIVDQLSQNVVCDTTNLRTAGYHPQHDLSQWLECLHPADAK